MRPFLNAECLNQPPYLHLESTDVLLNTTSNVTSKYTSDHFIILLCLNVHMQEYDKPHFYSHGVICVMRHLKVIVTCDLKKNLLQFCKLYYYR